jgi:hypothetical protein
VSETFEEESMPRNKSASKVGCDALRVSSIEGSSMRGCLVEASVTIVGAFPREYEMNSLRSWMSRRTRKELVENP